MDEFLTGMLVDNAVGTIVTALASGIAGFLISQVTKFSKRERARMDIDLCTAHNDLLEAYQKYVIEKHKLSIDSYKYIQKLFAAYKTLGGNGTVEKYMDELLAIKPYLITE